MSLGRIGARGALVAIGLLIFALSMSAPAWAEAPTTICVPERASTQVLSTNTKGECPNKTISKTTVKYKAEALPGPAELEKLDKLLPHISYVESGIAGKPTIQFSGVNVQIINGEGKTATTNGEGNLVLGYDENPAKDEQTGSHDLILGEEATFTSYGGLLAGEQSTVTAPFGSVSGGERNTASGLLGSGSGVSFNSAIEELSSVTGGRENRAEGFASSVTGGNINKATREYATVTGGFENTASGEYATVTGGALNFATASESAVEGGFDNGAQGTRSVVVSGRENGTTGEGSSVGGGQGNTARGTNAAVAGGQANSANGEYSVVAGGRENRANGTGSAIDGGAFNVAGYFGSIAGGLLNETIGQGSWIGGGKENKTLEAESGQPSSVAKDSLRKPNTTQSRSSIPYEAQATRPARPGRRADRAAGRAEVVRAAPPLRRC